LADYTQANRKINDEFEVRKKLFLDFKNEEFQ